MPSNLPDEGVPPRAGHSMDLVIVQVASADLRKGMEALVQVEQVVKDAKISKVLKIHLVLFSNSNCRKQAELIHYLIILAVDDL